MINSVNAYNAEFYNVDIYVNLCCKKTKKKLPTFYQKKTKVLRKSSNFCIYLKVELICVNCARTI